jgi:ABC-2 type transport system permease protein
VDDYVEKIYKYLSILKIYIRNETLSKFQYRGALWADLLFFLFGYGTQFLLIFLMVNKFGSLDGWTQYEVMLLYSMCILTYTLACTFFRGLFNDMPEKIRTGEFDLTLTKPMKPFLYEIISAFTVYYVVHVFLALSMVFFSLKMIQVEITILKLMLFVLSTLGGALIQGGILILFSSASFYLIGDNPLVYGVFISLRMLVENPISIFPFAIQIVLTFIFPFAFISYYPAHYLLDKKEIMFHPILQYLSFPVGIFVFIISVFVWSNGVNKYHSSGN